jgi:hypothetical protein
VLSSKAQHETKLGQGEAQVRPFEFIIVFLSFIYTLGLTHLLFAATRMVRHRRTLIFSWPHAFWMFAVLLILLDNWIALWDFHTLNEITLGVLVGGAVLSVVQYFICARLARLRRCRNLQHAHLS